MVWTPHLIIGSIITTKTGNPAVGLVLAWLSHYLLDFIPHKEYSIPPVQQAHLWSWSTLLRTISKIFIDFCVGITVILLLFKNNTEMLPLALSGALLAIGPDGITFLFYRFQVKNRLLTIHQRFHEWCNVWYLKQGAQEPTVLGVLTQIILILLTINY